MPRRLDERCASRLKPSFGRGGRVVAVLLLMLGPMLAMSGCAFESHREDLRGQLDSGSWAEAAAAIDRAYDDGLYGEANALLYQLDRGTLAMVLGDHEQAFHRLDRAEYLIDYNFTRSLSADWASWIINDKTMPYAGEPYEDQYVNVLKMLMHLRTGRLENGAVTEALRLREKSDEWRDKYVELKQWAGKSADTQAAMKSLTGQDRYLQVQDEGEFIESTLGMYLSTLLWAHLGERNDQRIAAENLLGAVEMQREINPGVRRETFEGLAELQPDDVSLVVVALSGRPPYKQAKRVRLPLNDVYIKIEWPELVRRPSDVRSIVVRIDDGPGHELPLVENMGAVAAAMYERQLPMIYTKALTRSIGKSVAGGMLIHQAKRAKSGNGAEAELGVLGAYLANILISETEQADLRHWATMPSRAHAQHFALEPGTHRVTIEFLNRNGQRLGKVQEHEIDVERGRMVVLDAVKLR